MPAPELSSVRSALVAGLCAMVAAAVLVSPAVAQQDRLFRGDHPDCSTAMAESEKLNGPQLLIGATSCNQQRKPYEMTFLLIAGQVRSRTDLALLRPAAEVDRLAAGQLGSIMYYRAGGSGSNEVLQSAAEFDRLFQALVAWRPQFSEGYDPGWDYGTHDNHGMYDDMREEIMAGRLFKLTGYAARTRAPRFNELNAEIARLQRENPRGLQMGSEDQKRMMALSGELSDLKVEDPYSDHPMLQPRTQSAHDRLAPDLGADTRQIHTGFNGPATRGTYAFMSRKKALDSWLARAIPQAKLIDLLDDVDFARQMVVAFTFGAYDNATGRVVMTQAYPEANTYGGKVGVAPRDCDQPRHRSYPFALLIAPRPEKTDGGNGRSNSNFPDGCKVAMKGTPTLTMP